MIRMAADLNEAVIVIAREAGAAIMAVYENVSYENALAVGHKADASPLTAADMAAMPYAATMHARCRRTSTTART